MRKPNNNKIKDKDLASPASSPTSPTSPQSPSIAGAMAATATATTTAKAGKKPKKAMIQSQDPSIEGKYVESTRSSLKVRFFYFW